MKTEISAGGVVFRQTDKKIEILLLKDKNDQWSFPKGLIEDNEKKLFTAQREVAEEVGLDKIKLVAELSPIKYFYRWQGELVNKTVYFYLFETSDGDEVKPQLEEGISAVGWFELEEAKRIIGYRKTNHPILEEAIKKINNAMV